MGLSVTSVHDVLHRPGVIKASHSCVSNWQKCQQLLSTVSKGMYCQHQHQLPSTETISSSHELSSTVRNGQQFSATARKFSQLSWAVSNCWNGHKLLETDDNIQNMSSSVSYYQQMSGTVSKWQKLTANVNNCHELPATVGNRPSKSIFFCAGKFSD